MYNIFVYSLDVIEIIHSNIYLFVPWIIDVFDDQVLDEMYKRSATLVNYTSICNLYNKSKQLIF